MYICIYFRINVLKYKKNCLQLDIALWCKNQIEHSIWDESLLFSNCARSLEYSSSSTLAGLSYHICGKLEVAFKGSLTDNAGDIIKIQMFARASSERSQFHNMRVMLNERT